MSSIKSQKVTELFSAVLAVVEVVGFGSELFLSLVTLVFFSEVLAVVEVVDIVEVVVVVVVVLSGPHLVFSLLNLRVLTLVQPASPTI